MVFNCPYYDEDIGQADFKEWLSIKLILQNESEREDILYNAIFYLNSYYLRPIGMEASIVHLHPTDKPYPWRSEHKDSVSRHRIRTRKQFLNSEPLLLFNSASVEEGNNKFLCYYKVLEYFFDKGIISTIRKMRQDANITEEKIIKYIRTMGEREQLYNLLDTVLTESQKLKIYDNAERKGLINKKSLECFCDALYTHRCDVVHAKEKKLDRTKLPNPLRVNTKENLWAKIIQELSIRTIVKMNT